MKSVIFTQAQLDRIKFIDPGVYGLMVAINNMGVLPNGGTTGQVIKKLSNSDFDYGWAADADTDTNPDTPIIAVETIAIATATPYQNTSAKDIKIVATIFHNETAGDESRLKLYIKNTNDVLNTGLLVVDDGLLSIPDLDPIAARHTVIFIVPPGWWYGFVQDNGTPLITNAVAYTY
jgi:hypothetical protein